MVKVRRVLYTSKGYVKGEFIGNYPGDIEDVYDEFSQLWMEENSDKDNLINENVTEADVDYVDEFTFCGEDSFCVGVRNGMLYEGISDDYQPYPGMVVDAYGFEQMIDADGKKISYTKALRSA